ncbi:MAG: putative ribosomal N-acetyltransferase YdaF [Mucilaginibacter sp.]|nr:putative ribosomal N-acetyltransferase YdaF [Mucilaginibacter sp.]
MEPGKEQIMLTTERLLFRQHTMADMDAFCAMEQDPEVRRYVGGKPRTREEAEHRFINDPLQPIDDRMAVWATILKSENRYIGRSGVYPHYKPDGEIIKNEGALSFYIAHEYWGNGFATEAGRAFIQFAFNQLKLKRIVAVVEVGNDASVHIIKKLGFTLVETECGPRSFYHFVLKNASDNPL